MLEKEFSSLFNILCVVVVVVVVVVSRQVMGGVGTLVASFFFPRSVENFNKNFFFKEHIL